jgi:hypothetical protein
MFKSNWHVHILLKKLEENTNTMVQPGTHVWAEGPHSLSSSLEAVYGWSAAECMIILEFSRGPTVEFSAIYV